MKYGSNENSVTWKMGDTLIAAAAAAAAGLTTQKTIIIIIIKNWIIFMFFCNITI